MELQQLRYFLALADLGSFTKAAERCHVAQPSLSQQIIKLEKELQQPLLERLGRTIRLTEAGQSLYEHAMTILASVEEAKCCITEGTADQGGTVNVGAIPTVAPYLLPALASQFQRRQPGANIVLHEDFTEHTIQNCLSGELDLGILAMPVPEGQLHVEPLFEEELLLALPARHPLAKKRRVTMADLNGQPFILLSEVHCLGRQIVSFCNQESCSPFMVCRTAQLLTVQELVSVGHGVSLLPAMACKLDRNSQRVYRHLADVKPMRTLAMIWRRQRYQRPIVQHYIAYLRKRLQKVHVSNG
jgi:LysR family hydrogen peroxide-inducible transcriptional activator